MAVSKDCSAIKKNLVFCEESDKDGLGFERGKHEGSKQNVFDRRMHEIGMRYSISRKTAYSEINFKRRQTQSVGRTARYAKHLLTQVNFAGFRRAQEGNIFWRSACFLAGEYRQGSFEIVITYAFAQGSKIVGDFYRS